MNRRHFLALASVLPLVGCRPRSTPGERVNAADRDRIATETSAREELIAKLANFRVPAGATRTTPARPVEVVKAFPELKTRVRMAVRLHPRASTEPAPNESKLAGPFFWPASEPWPECERFKIPLAPVLQLKLTDAPPLVTFYPGADLLQLFWSPREHDGLGPLPKVVWRSSESVRGSLCVPPAQQWGFPSYVPLPCRLFPERVAECPDFVRIPDTAMKAKFEAWKPAEAGGKSGIDFYKDDLSAAPGTKIGGYPRWAGEAHAPSCDTCQWGMDYLLTIDSHEWSGNTSWIPREEAGAAATSGYATASGLTLPAPGNQHIFVCRRCEAWPVKGVRG